jgi:hypothetical protein
MAQIRREVRLRGDQSSVSVLYAAGPILAGAAALFLVLYELMQPKVLPNPGLAAYVPPADTRPVPLPRRGDELASPLSPSTAFAQASESKPDSADLPAPGRQRAHPTKAAPREAAPRQSTYAQQSIFGYRGGPRSPF